MISSIFKKSIVISLLGHMAAFGIFNITFGSLIPRADRSSVFFWGEFLNNSEVSQERITPSIPAQRQVLFKKPDTTTIDKKGVVLVKQEGPYIKPTFYPQFSPQKTEFIQPQALSLPVVKKNKEIIFHPLIPYGFTLYFKDRQVAHVELLFNTSSADIRRHPVVKRKISSGNLDADLLIMRYISHYLFIQEARIPAGGWQSVKIDLSAKSD
ncbi:MAG: hypothetical protein PHG40_02310 [Candidatus Omnitrophica bacterium]|nr:hypothetical protein [Candidatus Omnitrophota bacterium]